MAEGHRTIISYACDTCTLWDRHRACISRDIVPDSNPKCMLANTPVALKGMYINTAFTGFICGYYSNLNLDSFIPPLNLVNFHF